MSSEKHFLLAAATLVLLSSATFGTIMACTDIVVTNLGDTGPGSLRQALLDVCPAGTITFDPSLNGQTLVLGGGQLVVNKDLSVIGPGANQLSLSGGKKNRVFQILAGANVRITGITIRDGKTDDGVGADLYDTGNGGDGGGILNEGVLTLENCDLTANETGNGSNSGRGGHGGAISNSGSLVTVHCRIFGNVTGTGGLRVDGYAGAIAGAGGGIYNGTSGVLAVDHCMISTNSTAQGLVGFNSGGNSGNGGGVFSASTNVARFTASSLVGNFTGSGGNTDPFNSSGNGGSAGQGGAMFAAGPVQLEDCLLVDNHTGKGGAGGYKYGQDGDGGSGGGLSVHAATDLTNTTFRGNRAGDGGRGGRGGDGGAVFASGPIRVTACAFIQNNAGLGGPGRFAIFFGPSATSGGSGGGGGGLWALANAEIANSTFSGNRAGSGGNGGDGIDFEEFRQPGASAGRGGSGGAIAAAGGAALRNCTVVDNTAGTGGAPGSGLITGQPGNPGSGGGLAVTGTKPVSVANTLLAINHGSGTSPDVGGAITSLGYNLVGITEGSVGFGAPGDLVGTASSPLTPGIGPLADNRGRSLTHALLPGSPAIDSGSDALAAGLVQDQRGSSFLRIIGRAVDIGAYELSVAFVSIQKTPTGTLLKLQGLPNSPLEIEWISELRSTDWHPLFSGMTDAAGNLEHEETGAPAVGNRFYRGILPQQ